MSAGISAQVNFLDTAGTRCTHTSIPERVLEHARELDAIGFEVTSVAIYRYTARDVRMVAIWTGAVGTYWGSRSR